MAGVAPVEDAVDVVSRRISDPAVTGTSLSWAVPDSSA
jgi:hypothetical protein